VLTQPMYIFSFFDINSGQSVLPLVPVIAEDEEASEYAKKYGRWDLAQIREQESRLLGNVPN